MRSTITRAGAFFVAVFGISIASDGAPLYTLTDLGQLSGTTQGQALGINSYGQVAGIHMAPGIEARAFLWTPTTANGKTGSNIDLGELAAGSGAGPRDINDWGQVVGSATDATGQKAFLWTPTAANGTTGSMIPLNQTPPFVGSIIATGINAFGQVVGSRNFLWTPTSPHGTTGSMVSIGALGSGDTISSAINTSGQIVGFSAASGTGHAFLWTPNTPNGATGSMTDLGLLPDPLNYSNALGVNSLGHAVGVHDDPGGSQAFLWTPNVPNGSTGSMTDLGTGAALAVNDVGQVVGGFAVVRGFTHAFTWTPADGKIDLNSLLDASGAGWELEEARDINNLGQIVGWGIYDPDGLGGVDGIQRAFLLSPVPEPFSVAFLGIASFGMLRVRGRRSRMP